MKNTIAPHIRKTKKLARHHIALRGEKGEL